MSRIHIRGGKRLSGSVEISGAKNAALPILAASLLASEGESQLFPVPYLNDVNVMLELLHTLGVRIETNGGDRVFINAQNLTSAEAPYELVSKMRASVLIMGPLLARTGRARISLPGGCAIGSRPIDLHLKGFAALGADIIIGHGYVEAEASKLQGAEIYLDYPSVGATENILTAAVLADGVTILENAAEEPEIVDLADYLRSMGAIIYGAGSDRIVIEGVQCLTGSVHRIIPDRIEAGTYMVAAALTHGDVTLHNVEPNHLRPVIAKLREAGVEVEEQGRTLSLHGPSDLHPLDLKTLPYPGFPTDMQPQFMALLTQARGISVMTETVFENRFMHVPELRRMGAEITVHGRQAIVKGPSHLTGAQVSATDLRAGAALVVSGLAAEGETIVSGVYHVDRGYVGLVEKLQNLGAQIERAE